MALLAGFRTCGRERPGDGRVPPWSVCISFHLPSALPGCSVVQHAPDIYRACATPDNPSSAGSHPRSFLRAPRTQESSPCARWALSLELGVVMSKRRGPFLSEATVSLKTEEGPCLPLPPTSACLTLTDLPRGRHAAEVCAGAGRITPQLCVL